MHKGTALGFRVRAGSRQAERPSRWAFFFRRRRFIVDGRFQGMLLLSILLQTLAFAGVLAFALFLPTILAIREAAPGSTHLLDASREMLALDDRFWPALGAAFVLSALLALHTSHKIAGPLYRFRRVFDAIIHRRDPGPVRLRKHDYLKPEAEFLDRVVESVLEDRARLNRVERIVRLALDELARLDPSITAVEGIRDRLAVALEEEPGDED